jgi:hypothetical protein
MEPYLINEVQYPIATIPRKAGGTRRRRTMRLKRNRKGQFLPRGSRKNAPKRRKSRKSRKSTMPKVTIKGGKKRRRHRVKAYDAKGGPVKGYTRGGRSVPAHLSNPFGGLGQMGQASMEGLIAAGVLFGSLIAVGFVYKQLDGIPALTGNRWVNLGVKLGATLGVVWAAREVARRGFISHANAKVAQAAAFAPLGMTVLTMALPQVAGMVHLSADPSELSQDDIDAELSMRAGNRISDYTIDAELSAELSRQETESSMF